MKKDKPNSSIPENGLTEPKKQDKPGIQLLVVIFVIAVLVILFILWQTNAFDLFST